MCYPFLFYLDVNPLAFVGVTQFIIRLCARSSKPIQWNWGHRSNGRMAVNGQQFRIFKQKSSAGATGLFPVLYESLEKGRIRSGYATWERATAGMSCSWWPLFAYRSLLAGCVRPLLSLHSGSAVILSSLHQMESHGRYLAGGALRLVI